jgi:outer membrane protein TolC
MNREIPAAASFAVLLFCGFFSGAAAATAQTTRDTGVPVVTLPEARRRALLADPVAVAARGRAETAVWERRAARSDLITPGVAVGTNFTRCTDRCFNFATGGQSRNATSATLQANYTLLGAGKVGELKRAGAALESAEAGETAARFVVALATDAAYYAALANRELSRVATDRLKRAQEQFGVARVRVRAGEAIATDSLQLLLEVNRARLVVLRNDSALAVSQLRLGRQIGLAGPAEPAPVDSTLAPDLPLTQEQAIAALRATGPEITAARAVERQAEAMVGVQRERYLPEISVGAVTGAYDSQFFPDGLKRGQLVVTASLPVWNSGHRELALARARADRNTARALREDTDRSSAEVMTGAWQGYHTARANIEFATTGVAAATENYRVQRTRYREGATTILDLLEAQFALSEAEATLVQSRYATRLALARIEALLGRRLFGPQDTNPDNR